MLSLNGNGNLYVGAFTPGTGATAYAIATTGIISAGNGISFRSPIHGDSAFSGFKSSTYNIDIITNGATIGGFNSVGGAASGNNFTLINGYNPQTGSGIVNTFLVSPNIIPTTGTNTITYNFINVSPTINQTTFGTGLIRGFYYNPTLTSLNTSVHRAIETVTGNVLFNTTSGNTLIGTSTDNGGKLQIKAPGALSTDIALRVRNSADTADLLSLNGLGGITSTGITALDISTATQVNSAVVVFNTKGASGGYDGGYDFKTGNNNSYGTTTALRIWSNSVTNRVGIGTLTEANINNGSAQLYINNKITGGRNAGLRISASAISNTEYNGIQFDLENLSLNGGAFVGVQRNFSTGYATDLVILNTSDSANSYTETARFVGKYSSFYVGSDKTLPVASAKLQVESTTQGFLPPRMTTTQKNAITTPASGLVVYDTTLGKLCVRGATAWETITSV